MINRSNKGKVMYVKDALRLIREELTAIETDDVFVSEAINKCIALCNKGLSPGELPPHQRHSETSTAAAIGIKDRFPEMTESILVLFSKEANGLTDEEGQIITGINGNSYRPCRITLYDLGHVAKSGNKRYTTLGNKAEVWMITDKGRAYVQEMMDNQTETLF